MNTNTITAMYDDYRKGKLNENSAIGSIFQGILDNKPFFGLKTLDDDNMNDFFLYIYDSLKKSFKTFDNSKSSFLTYLQNIIRLNYKSWIRITSRLKSEQKYIINHSKTEYCEKEAESLFSCDKHDVYTCSAEETALDKLQLLVVALKSSYFLTSNHISSIARKTGYEEDYIWKLKRLIDDHMLEKYEKNNARIEKINRSYFYRQRALEVLCCIKKSHPQYDKVYKTFLFHDENWKNKRENIRFRTIIPVNSYIASLLNISESAVIRAVSKAKKLYLHSSKNS